MFGWLEELNLQRNFMRLKLADDIIIFIMPVILERGTLFFDYIGKERLFHLKGITAHKDGMVELWYKIKNLRRVNWSRISSQKFNLINYI